MRTNLLIATFTTATLMQALAPAWPQTAPQNPVLVGGYKKASVKAPDVRAAALFAVGAAPEPAKLSWLISAETQVVAGVNYRLCMAVKAPDAGHFSKAHLVQAEVYRDLGNQFSLTSWQATDQCKP